MFTDPFNDLIDYQLRSLQARLEEVTILGCFPQTSTKNDRTEEMLIEAFDRKYHSPELWEGRRGRVINLYQQGFTQIEIAAEEKISQAAIHKILKTGGTKWTKTKE
uniref:Uncharacterized protein n=1 Tax=viral metagenome TaxID=1070528 RepID=A0A6M3JW64_9ZZZZ